MTGEILKRYFKLLTSFRNGGQMVRTLRGGPHCTKAVLWNGTTITHPDRPGLVEAITEIWTDHSYTRGGRLRPGDVVIDIGANVGLFSVLAARSGCTVLAFEPFAENFEHLARNSQDLQIQVFSFAIGGAAGSGNMQTGGPRSLDHKLDASRSGDTEIITLEQALDLAAVPTIALLKMDIEGAEADVFATVTPETLARIDQMVVEYHDNIRPGTLALIQSKLANTHTVRVEPTPYDCGLVFATRRR